MHTFSNLHGAQVLSGIFARLFKSKITDFELPRTPN